MKKVIICLMVMFTSGCLFNSRQTNFYNIAPMNEDSLKIVDNRKLIIGIDYVAVPGYLERPQIVTLKNESDTEFNLAEFDRWAEPIANTLQRSIAFNLSDYLKKSIVRPSGTNRRGFDYIITIDISKLDGKFNDKAYLSAWWTVLDKDGRSLINEQFAAEEPLGDSYEDYVLKQSMLVSKLSQTIALRINKLK